MHASIEKIFSIIFPKSEGALMVERLSYQQLDTAKEITHTNGIRSLLTYRDTRVRSLIHEAKFHHNKHALHLLGCVLDEYLTAHQLSNGWLIIPIPLSRARMRARGYNQVTEILKTLSDTTLPIETGALIKHIHTPPQTELDRDKRMHNVKNAFMTKKPDILRSKHILLVDDVITTGATMRAAKAALVPHHPASITCVALAH